MKIDYKNLNKVRVHNKNELVKHFIIKAMILKIFFNSGYEVYTECEIGTKVCDVLAIKKKCLPTVIEIESNPTLKHDKDLFNYYSEKEMNLYIIYSDDVPNDIKLMETYLKGVFGL